MRISDGDGFGRMVGSRTKDDAQNVVVVFFSLFESLDNKRPYAVCMAIHTSGDSPGLASVMPFGEEATAAQTSETIQVSQHIETTSDRGIDIAVLWAWQVTNDSVSASFDLGNAVRPSTYPNRWMSG